ncbi:MAG: hypothetical protein JWM44_1200 [Bacilli bacterium]|nr:hypothetical protein [Bacilli bacterium]
MSEIKSKAVTITLDKERNLIFDMNAFIELEDKFGSLDAVITELSGRKLKSMRTIFWAGLVHEDETLTEKRVGEIMSLDDATGLAEKAMQAILEGLPKPKNQVPNPRTNRKTVK